MAELSLRERSARFADEVQTTVRVLDARDGWEEAVDSGREQWRRRQTRTVARDAQEEVASALREVGWTVTPPAEDPGESVRILRTW